MATSDTVADYFSHLKNGVGWESFLADDMVFTSFTTPVKQVTGRAAYLESTKQETVPYYMRFGFEVTGEIKLPDGGPSMWPMWRAPR